MPWSPRQNHLRFDVEQSDGRATVRLAGELDCASAAIAHLALERAGAGGVEITLDLSRLVFLDAAGLRFLISAQQRARAANRRLIVRRPSHSVRRMLDLTGAHGLLGAEDTDVAALPPAAGELTRLLEAAAQRAMRIADADRYTVQLLDPATDALRIVAQRGFNRTFLAFFDTVDDTDSVYGTALRRRQPVWVRDVTQSSIFADGPALDVIWDTGVRALAALPVTSPDGQVFAMLAVYRARPIDWGADRRAQLKRLVRAAARDCLDAMHATSLT